MNVALEVTATRQDEPLGCRRLYMYDITEKNNTFHYNVTNKCNIKIYRAMRVGLYK